MQQQRRNHLNTLPARGDDIVPEIPLGAGQLRQGRQDVLTDRVAMFLVLREDIGHQSQRLQLQVPHVLHEKRRHPQGRQRKQRALAERLRRHHFRKEQRDILETRVELEHGVVAAGAGARPLLLDLGDESVLGLGLATVQRVEGGVDRVMEVVRGEAETGLEDVRIEDFFRHLRGGHDAECGHRGLGAQEVLAVQAVPELPIHRVGVFQFLENVGMNADQTHSFLR